MRKEVEAILGYTIPKDLDFVLQRGIVAGKSAEQIAKDIQLLIQQKGKEDGK